MLLCGNMYSPTSIIRTSDIRYLDYPDLRRASRDNRTLVFPSPFFLVGSSLTSLGMSSAKRKASPPPASRGKRKRVVLTISQKLEICDLVTSRRLSYGDIARKYGIGRQTVADIKKKEKDLREFQRGAV